MSFTYSLGIFSTIIILTHPPPLSFPPPLPSSPSKSLSLSFCSTSAHSFRLYTPQMAIVSLHSRCTSTYTHMRTHTHTHTHIHTHAHTQTHMHTCTRKHTHTHTHTHIQKHTHANTHTHTHARSQAQPLETTLFGSPSARVLPQFTNHKNNCWQCQTK